LFQFQLCGRFESAILAARRTAVFASGGRLAERSRVERRTVAGPVQPGAYAFVRARPCDGLCSVSAERSSACLCTFGGGERDVSDRRRRRRLLMGEVTVSKTRQPGRLASSAVRALRRSFVAAVP